MSGNGNKIYHQAFIDLFCEDLRRVHRSISHSRPVVPRIFVQLSLASSFNCHFTFSTDFLIRCRVVLRLAFCSDRLYYPQTLTCKPEAAKTKDARLSKSSKVDRYAVGREKKITLPGKDPFCNTQLPFTSRVSYDDYQIYRPKVRKSNITWSDRWQQDAWVRKKFFDILPFFQPPMKIIQPQIIALCRLSL